MTKFVENVRTRQKSVTVAPFTAVRDVRSSDIDKRVKSYSRVNDRLEGSHGTKRNERGW